MSIVMVINREPWLAAAPTASGPVFRSISAISTWWLAYGKERRKEGFMKALTTSPHVGQNVVRSADAMWGL